MPVTNIWPDEGFRDHRLRLSALLLPHAAAHLRILRKHPHPLGVREFRKRDGQQLCGRHRGNRQRQPGTTDRPGPPDIRADPLEQQLRQHQQAAEGHRLRTVRTSAGLSVHLYFQRGLLHGHRPLGLPEPSPRQQRHRPDEHLRRLRLRRPDVQPVRAHAGDQG